MVYKKRGNDMKTYKFVRNTVLMGIFIVLITAGLVQSVSEAYIQERYPNNNGDGQRDEPNINITLIGSCETSYRALELGVQDDYAYLATHLYTHSCPPYSGALDVVDIATNPENPEITGSCDDFQQLLNVVVHDDYAYVIVREDQTFFLKEVNIQNPAHPILYEFLSIELGGYPNSDTIDLFVANDLLYVFTPGNLIIYAIPELEYLNSITLNDPTSLSHVDDLFVYGDYAYLIGNNMGNYKPKEFFRIINIADPWNLYQMVNVELGNPHFVNHLSINQIGDTLYAYFAAWGGLYVLDVTDPENPSTPITFTMPHPSTYIRSDGSFVYISAGPSGIYVLDIADPVVPVYTGFYNTTGNASAIVVVGNYIYVADDESGFLILQFTNVEGPSTPDQPFGPITGEPDVIYRFYVQLPPEAINESIYLLWDWGDGTSSGWLGPYGPYYPREPPTVSESNGWEQGGEFSIRVKAKNSQQIESDWSEPHVITIINDPPSAPSLPTGPTEGYRYKEYDFSTSAIDPDDELYYQWSFGDEITGWIGPYKSGEVVTVHHVWETIGNYEVKAQAKDGHDAIGDWSLPLNIQIINQAPDIPDTPSGPTSGNIQTAYTFSTKTNDIDNDQVFYKWDWDDGTQSDWLGPYDPTVVATAEHSWTEAGEYSIRVKAKDAIGDESSGWSQPLNVQISAAELSLSFKGGLGLTLIIENIGDVAAEDVQYTITFEGKHIFLPKNATVQGVLYESILAGESAVVDVFVLGLGRTTISAVAEIPDVTTASTSTNAFIFGPFVLIRDGSRGLLGMNI